MTEHLGKRLKRWRVPFFCSVASLAALVVGSDFAKHFKFFDAVEASTSVKADPLENSRVEKYLTT